MRNRFRHVPAGCAVVMLLAPAAAHAIVQGAVVDMTLDAPGGGINELAITALVDGSPADSAISTVSGNVLAGLQVNATAGSLTPTQLSFIGGDLFLSDVNLDIDFGVLLGSTTVTTTGMSGDLSTPVLPGSVNPAGQFPVSEHLLTLNGGSVDYVSSGAAAIFVGDGSIDLAVEPAAGSGIGTGQLTFDLVSTQGIQRTYDVSMTVPISFTSNLIDTPVVAALAVDGVIAAGGQFTLDLALTGDANNDFVVTADDLIAGQQNFGNVGPPNDGSLIGDANDDGVVTSDDLISTQQNFGNTLGAVGAAPGSGSAVPEPGAAVLLGVAAVVVINRRR